jgi:hypothetical protein
MARDLADLDGPVAVKRLATGWVGVGIVVNATDFFLSPASEFSTGQMLFIGGVTAGRSSPRRDHVCRARCKENRRW